MAAVPTALQSGVMASEAGACSQSLAKLCLPPRVSASSHRPMHLRMYQHVPDLWLYYASQPAALARASRSTACHLLHTPHCPGTAPLAGEALPLVCVVLQLDY